MLKTVYGRAAHTWAALVINIDQRPKYEPDSLVINVIVKSGVYIYGTIGLYWYGIFVIACWSIGMLWRIIIMVYSNTVIQFSGLVYGKLMLYQIQIWAGW